MSHAAAQPARPRTWIVSPVWDLFYLVLTPVLIVPAVLVAARYWLTPEQVYLAVISFASLGHHLPGFMRAYGDRELFLQYRWRFLLAPPLVLGTALLFTPPQTVASVLRLPWTHLHGMELILLVWGTWHGLMQTYGFMRIYDLRRGENDLTTARLDQALCILIFVAGVVFSDVRMFGIAAAMWQTGLPLFGPEVLAALRWIVGGVGTVVALLYVVQLANRRRRGLTINGVKLLLAAVTGWFYWYCGRLSTNLLIGVAMFEIYHAVQYNAIVWIYNRRLLERAGQRFGPLGFLFRDRTTMLCAYLAAIAAYSSIRFFTARTGDRMFSGDLDEARQWVVALFVTSSFLHFYYDGFIWKVSQSKTRANLVDEPASLPGVDRYVPSLVHAGKWVMLLSLVAMLIASERAYTSGETDEGARNERMLAALAALTPKVPEAQEIVRQFNARDAETYYQTGLDLLKKGEAQPAIAPLRKAVKLDPEHFQARLQLGDALLAEGKPAAAAEAYHEAIELCPESPDARVALADAQIKSGDTSAAEATLREGLVQQPDSPELCYTLGLLLQQLGRIEEAAPLLQKAAQKGLRKP
jgi:tetratricopeptide (TPR) repeat protein